jgi:hypothetical protein
MIIKSIKWIMNLLMPGYYENQFKSFLPCLITYFIVYFFASHIPLASLFITLPIAFIVGMLGALFMISICENDKKFLVIDKPRVK